MKRTTLISLLIVLMLSVLALAATHTLNTPAQNAQQTTQAVTFNWTPTSVNTTLPSYVWLSDPQSNLSNLTYRMNKTIYTCTNSSSNPTCNTTISLTKSGTYSWYIVTGDNATRPTIELSLSTINTTLHNNNTLNFTFTQNASSTVFDSCQVVLPENDALNTSSIAGHIRANCNLNAENFTNRLVIQNNHWGIFGNLSILEGNLSRSLGLIPNATYRGNQSNFTSSSRWIRIRLSGEQNTSYHVFANNSDYVAATINKDNGNLSVSGNASVVGSLFVDCIYLHNKTLVVGNASQC